jgi:hypothetical protein
MDLPTAHLSLPAIPIEILVQPFRVIGPTARRLAYSSARLQLLRFHDWLDDDRDLLAVRKIQRLLQFNRLAVNYTP